jgi:hypothetical protein
MRVLSRSNTLKMTSTKINVDKVSLNLFFKTVAKINDETNETSFIHSITKRRLQVQIKHKSKPQSFVRLIDFLTQSF